MLCSAKSQAQNVGKTLPILTKTLQNGYEKKLLLTKNTFSFTDPGKNEGKRINLTECIWKKFLLS
jgi:hypothetical protein